MKKYQLFMMETLNFTEDTIRTSGVVNVDEGTGAGNDYFAEDDFVIPNV